MAEGVLYSEKSWVDGTIRCCPFPAVTIYIYLSRRWGVGLGVIGHVQVVVGMKRTYCIHHSRGVCMCYK